MKKIFQIVIILFSLISFAQSPNKISYQAVIRNASNNLITNTNVGIRVSVLQGSSTGTTVYQETHSATTNATGLVTLEVGAGTVLSGTFSSIAWSSGNYYIKTETDVTGGTNYTISGTSQLLSVPYALYSTISGSDASSTWTVNGSNQYSNVTGNVGIGTTTPTSKLDIQNTSNATVSVTSTSNNGYFTAAAPSGLEAALTLKTYSSGSSKNRWNFGKSTTPETGSNSGSNFFINAYDDSGSYLSQPFTITRSSGLVTVNSLKTSNFQLTNGASNGYILQSDASGNASWVSNTISIPSKIQDADANTKIQTEESTNENIIRFDLNGTEKWVMQGSRLEAKNTGNSIFIGENAGKNDDLNSHNNVAIGYNSLTTETGSDNNIAIGSNSLKLNTASNNIAIGNNALQANTTGEKNTVVGNSAATANTTGLNNVFVGNNSGAANTTANYNSALGYYSLNSNVVGSNNSAFGSWSLNNATSSNNTAFGYNSGTNITSGGSNTFLGYNANATSGTLTNATAIGANASVDSSNSLILGNNVNVGIGTSSPTNTLHIESSVENPIYMKSTSSLGSQIKLEVYNNSTSYPWKIGPLWGTSGYSNGTFGISTNGTQVFNSSSSITSFPSTIVMFYRTTNFLDEVGISDGSRNYNPTGAYYYINGNMNCGDSVGCSGGGGHTWSLVAGGRIAATEFDAYSDARIKKIVNRSKSEEDLELLNKIQITDYKYIDNLSKGDKIYKKVIAQEVEAVYPNVVSTKTEAIPNIYAFAKYEESYFNIKNDLVVGDKVRIMIPKGDKTTPMEFEVLNADKNKFSVHINSELLENNKTAFIYGKIVNDFRTVDYEALTTLNISATQELLKKIQNLEVENQKLKVCIQDIENIKAELNSIKKELTQPNLISENK